MRLFFTNGALCGRTGPAGGCGNGVPGPLRVGAETEASHAHLPPLSVCVGFRAAVLWTGLCMSELILDGASSTVDLSAFDPGRYMPAASRKRGRKAGDKDVGEQW